MKNLVFLALLLGSITTVKAQISGRSLPYIQGNSPFRYFVGKTEPDAAWKNKDFDDSAWKSDTLAIGYGNGYGKKDSTLCLIDTATSIYLRYHFTAQAPLTKTASFLPVFDDGIVAYLNGVEIMRFNMGKKGEATPFNRLADRSWEAPSNWGELESYYFDSTIMKNVVAGDNVLTIEVHNDSVKGSDLLFACGYLMGIDTAQGGLYDLPNRVHRHLELDSSEFPIVFIDTDEYGIPKGVKNKRATMRIIDNGSINKPTMTAKISTSVSIDVHGQSSANFAKRSYNIELKSPVGTDTSLALMGMPAEEDWLLYAPFNDKSLVRNDIVFELGRQLGHYEPRTRKCELILNGEYRGLYIMTEKIKRGKDRVAISKLDTTENSGFPLTGGYVVKYDKVNDHSVDTLLYVSPNADNITKQQREYIKDYFADLATVLKSPKVADSVEGYHKYINPQSLIDYVIINEVIRGADSYNLSTFMYKDRDDKDGRLNFGPMWDSDLTFGASFYQWANLTTGWQFAINQRLTIGRYMADVHFKNAFIERWNTLRKTTLSKESLNTLIDSKVADLKTAKDRNYLVWPLRKIQYFGTNHYYTYEEDVAAMKAWLSDRLIWIDNNITKINYKLPVDLTAQSSTNSSLYLYPQNITAFFTVHGMVETSGNYTISLVSETGQVNQNIYSANVSNGYQVFECQLSQHFTPGIYFITLACNGNPIQTFTCFINQD